MTGGTVLVLGGAGLVGMQVARQIAVDLRPERLVVAARRAESAAAAVAALRELAPAGVQVVGESGDVFVRSAHSTVRRADLLEDPGMRDAVCDDLLGPIDGAYGRSALAALIRRHRPDVVVDAVNTATAISYQDVHAAARRAMRTEDCERDVGALVLSLALPQLIRHVLILHRALCEAGTRVYLKVGTTGSGGMGLDVPFTHSEDKPSAQLLTKAAVAFAHTGLLLLMARTAGGPVVKEVKPGAMIGYADVAHRPITERGEPVWLYEAQVAPLEGMLAPRHDPIGYERRGELRVPVVDTGENGVFTRGEFAVITAPGSMEFVTPEEIAALCVAEIAGGNTGRDVLAALNSAILGPSYRAGTLRATVLGELDDLVTETGTASVALGQLGPPELGKLLWEAELLKAAYGDTHAVVAARAEDVAARVERELSPLVRDVIVSAGLGVLAPDGRTLWRGPRLRIPESLDPVPVDAASRDVWAARGWVDLRPGNWSVWQRRLRAIHAAEPAKALRGSAGVAPVPAGEIEPGEVVAWILSSGGDDPAVA